MPIQTYDIDAGSDDFTYKCLVANQDMNHTNELEKILNQCQIKVNRAQNGYEATLLGQEELRKFDFILLNL